MSARLRRVNMLHVSFFGFFRPLRAASNRQHAGRLFPGGDRRRRGLSDLPVSLPASYQSAKVVVFGGGGCTKTVEFYAAVQAG